MNEEFQLLTFLLPGRVSIIDLNRHFSISLITEAKHNGFLEVSSSGACRLTDSGIQRRLFLRDELPRLRRETIRYRLTTAIAVVALVLSVIAILAESQVLPLRALLGLPPLS